MISIDLHPVCKTSVRPGRITNGMAAYAKCVRAVWAADADQRFTRASSDPTSDHAINSQRSRSTARFPRNGRGGDQRRSPRSRLPIPHSPSASALGSPTKQPRKARSRNYSPAFRRGFALSAPHDRIPVWATPLASQVLPRPSQPRRLLRGTLPSSAPLTGSPPCAFLLCSSAELKL